MEERKMEDLLIDYVEGSLEGELKNHVERTIEKDSKWKSEYEQLKKLTTVIDDDKELVPDSSLKEAFDQLVEEESSAIKGKVVAMKPSNNWLKVAASIMLIGIGAVIGMLIVRNQQHEEELAILKAELEQTKQLVFSSLDNQSSASRLNGINVAMVMNQSDDEIIDVLVKTMNADENTNVRLAAVAALARFADEEKVRKALIASLEIQDDPVVTIQLINLMVRLKEAGAVPTLKNLLKKDRVHGAVKQEVHLGLLELS